MNMDELTRKIARLQGQIRSLNLRADILHQDLQKVLMQSFRPGEASAQKGKNGRIIHQS
jgi:hypothetical protein